MEPFYVDKYERSNLILMLGILGFAIFVVYLYLSFMGVLK